MTEILTARLNTDVSNLKADLRFCARDDARKEAASAYRLTEQRVVGAFIELQTSLQYSKLLNTGGDGI